MLEFHADTAEAGLSTSLAFSLTNTGQQPVHFLYWKTVFDPVCPAGLVLEADGRDAASYRGPRAKYRFDPRVSLVTLAPGETVRAIVNVSENYMLAADGTYEVRLREDAIRGIVGELPADLAPCKFKGLSVAQRPGRHRLTAVDNHHLLPPAAPVEPFIPPHCQVPLCMDNGYYEEPVVCVMGKAVYAQARVEKATPAQQAIVRAAIERLFQRTVGPGRPPLDVKDDATYRRWFGAYTPELATRVRHAIGGIQGQAVCKRFVIYVVAQGPKPDTIAFFQKSDTPGRYDLMALCPPYFAEGESGKDSRAGTLAHELSHGYSGTDDHDYGVECCQRLARLRPDLAVANADSLQYYLEDTVLSLVDEEAGSTAQDSARG